MEFRVTSEEGGAMVRTLVCENQLFSVVAAAAQFLCHPAYAILDPSLRPVAVSLVVWSALLQLRQPE